MAQIFNKFTAPYVDYCLQNNEFLDDNHLWDLLEYADDDALAYVYKNRHKYSGEIQYLIEPADFIPSKVKTRTVELTSAEMDKINAKNDARVKREMEEAWEKLRSNTNRPLSDLDTEEMMANAAHSNAQFYLRTYVNKKGTTYVAPSARGRPDPEKERLEKRVEETARALDEARKRISHADEEFFTRMKDEFFSKMYGL